jgi:hypothetical protein
MSTTETITPDLKSSVQRWGQLSEDERNAIIEQQYAVVREGSWDEIMVEWENQSNFWFSEMCAKYKKPTSEWTFLHQAAFFGHRRACITLLRNKAKVDAIGRDGSSPINAAINRGHHELAEFLNFYSLFNRTNGIDASIPTVLLRDPLVIACCGDYDARLKARPSKASQDMFVAYGGTLVFVPKNSNIYVDSSGRVVIGFHGTFDPPRGMDGLSLFDWI